MRLTWLGHSAFRIEIPGAVLLIDPFLSGNPAFPGDHAAVLAGVTHIDVNTLDKAGAREVRALLDKLYPDPTGASGNSVASSRFKLPAGVSPWAIGGAVLLFCGAIAYAATRK